MPTKYIKRRYPVHRIIIRKPDDFHVHLRNGEMLKKVIPYSNIFGRVTVMGNLNPPIVTGQDAVRYHEEIIKQGARFRPIMSIMLVNQTTPKIIKQAYKEGVKVLKLIPGGTSTGSSEGVTLRNLENYYPCLEMAQNLGMIFSGHWELSAWMETGQAIAEAEREAQAIPMLAKVISNFPNLKLIVEHISTSAMVKVIEGTRENVAGTITGHHVGPFCADDVLSKKGEIISPLLYCKPILKTKRDIEVIRRAVLSGNPKFFFGSDSAPHPAEKKLGRPPAAGIFSAPVVLPHLWSIFEEKDGGIKFFDDFVSRFGAEFYGLPVNDGEITLEEGKWTVPIEYNGIVPFLAGKELGWKIVS
jgi:dihydroorotase